MATSQVRPAPDTPPPSTEQSSKIPFGSRIRLYWFYAILGVVNTLPALAILRDFQHLGFSMSTIQFLRFFIALPWSLKWIWGAIIDLLPFYGERFRPYVIIGNGGCVIAVLTLLSDNISQGGFVTVLIVLQIFNTLADVGYDARMVQESQHTSRQDEHSFQHRLWLARAIGTAAGRGLSGYTYEHGSRYLVYGAVSACYVAQIIVCAFMPKEPHQRKRERKATPTFGLFIDAVKASVSVPMVRKLLLLNIISGALPSAGLGVYFYLLDEVKISPSELGIMAMLGEFAKCIVIGLYDCVLKRFSIRRTFFYTSYVDLIVSSMPVMLVNGSYKALGMTPYIFALGDEVLSNGIEEMRNMPLLNLTKMASQHGVEATVYSFILSVVNFSQLLGAVTSAIILHAWGVDHYKFEHLEGLILTVVACTSITPALAFLLPRESTITLARANT